MTLRNVAAVLLLALPAIVAAPASASTSFIVEYENPPAYSGGLLPVPPVIDREPGCTYCTHLFVGATDDLKEFRERVPLQVCMRFESGWEECTDVFGHRMREAYEEKIVHIEIYVFSAYTDPEFEFYAATTGTVGYQF